MNYEYFKNKINVGLIALSAIMASGCDDSAFLKESPESSYAIENVFKSSNQVKQVLTSCYEKVRDIFVLLHLCSSLRDISIWEITELICLMFPTVGMHRI